MLPLSDGKLQLKANHCPFRGRDRASVNFSIGDGRFHLNETLTLLYSSSISKKETRVSLFIQFSCRQKWENVQFSFCSASFADSKCSPSLTGHSLDGCWWLVHRWVFVLDCSVFFFLSFTIPGRRKKKRGEESHLACFFFSFSPFLFLYIWVNLFSLSLSFSVFAFGLHLGGEEEAKRAAAAAEHRIAEPTYYPHRVPSEKKHTKTRRAVAPVLLRVRSSSIANWPTKLHILARKTNSFRCCSSAAAFQFVSQFVANFCVFCNSNLCKRVTSHVFFGFSFYLWMYDRSSRWQVSPFLEFPFNFFFWGAQFKRIKRKRVVDWL